MKKFILLILMPLCFLGLMQKVKASSSDYVIELEDDICYVPIGGDIEAALPRAYVYDDYEGHVVTTEGLIYSYDYQGIKLSNINRYVAGRYFIYMTVTHRNYSCRLFQRVDIVIYDDVDPTVNMIDSVRISYKDDFNINNYVSYTDNASTPCTVQIIGYYDKKIIGEYSLTVLVTDASNNETYKDFTLEIYDDVAPVIICDSVIEVDYDKEFNLYEYIKVVDECEGEVEFEASDFDKKTLGDKIVQIVAKDSSYNFALKNVILRVCDKTSPIIELKNLDLKEDEDYNLYDNIIGLTDNYDEVKIEDINITKSKVGQGKYLVTYSISDSSGNVGTKDCYIKYTYHNFPVIEEVNLDVVTDEFDPLFYINCYDVEDGDLNEKVMIIDMNYDERYCIYEVYDSDGNFTRKKVEFPVVEEPKTEDETSEEVKEVSDSTETEENSEGKHKLVYPEITIDEMENDTPVTETIKNTNETKTTNNNIIYYIIAGAFVLGIIIFILIKHFRKKMV